MKFFKTLAIITLALAAQLAFALDIEPYSAQALAQLQQAGKPVAVHFHATWCTTCRAQAKVFEQIKASGELPMTLLVADWDKEKALERKLGVRDRSTLIVYRGTAEKARLVGDTDPKKLHDALQAAL